MIEIHPIFKLRQNATEQIINLLDETVLGTNGAKYRHLDTKERIGEADQPLYLSLERNERVLANVTFCRRDRDWYIRYFAFNKTMQSSGARKSKANKNNLLRRELEKFFSESLKGRNKELNVDRFYAYIDPNNEKSLWMSENFGFKTVAKIATQTFSRVSPGTMKRVEQVNDWKEVEDLVKGRFASYNFFNTVHTCKHPIYVIRNNKEQIIALAKTSVANWQIERLPGKFGGVLVKLIPWIPVLRKLVRPKHHSFIVPEAVYVKDNNPELLEELFEGILHLQGLNLIIWWVDMIEPLYAQTKSEMSWGLLNKIIGVPTVNAVIRSKNEENVFDPSKPVYTIGFDFI